MDERLIAVFTSLLVQLPVYIVWIVGSILVLVRWKIHPKVSLLALVAFIGFFFTTTVGTFIRVWLPLYLIDSADYSSASIGMVLSIWNIIATILNLVFWILLLCALLGWRKEKKKISIANDAAAE